MLQAEVGAQQHGVLGEAHRVLADQRAAVLHQLAAAVAATHHLGQPYTLRLGAVQEVYCRLVEQLRGNLREPLQHHQS